MTTRLLAYNDNGDGTRSILATTHDPTIRDNVVDLDTVVFPFPNLPVIDLRDAKTSSQRDIRIAIAPLHNAQAQLFSHFGSNIISDGLEDTTPNEWLKAIDPTKVLGSHLAYLEPAYIDAAKGETFFADVGGRRSTNAGPARAYVELRRLEKGTSVSSAKELRKACANIAPSPRPWRLTKDFETAVNDFDAFAASLRDPNNSAPVNQGHSRFNFGLDSDCNPAHSIFHDATGKWAESRARTCSHAGCSAQATWINDKGKPVCSVHRDHHGVIARGTFSRSHSIVFQDGLTISTFIRDYGGYDNIVVIHDMSAFRWEPTIAPNTVANMTFTIDGNSRPNNLRPLLDYLGLPYTVNTEATDTDPSAFYVEL